MTRSSDTQNWRTRVGWLAGQLFVIFLGVTAAFLVENYRETLSQREELRQAVTGLITEFEHYETRSAQFANAFDSAIEKWKAADRQGQRAVPGYYRIPGASHPPTAAWTTTVNSGVARMFDPPLRTELGYYYSEFLGIHDHYGRYNQFTEREILPRLAAGPDAFYGADGKLLPMFRVHMDLQSEFAADLRRLGRMAHDLRIRLEALPVFKQSPNCSMNDLTDLNAFARRYAEAWCTQKPESVAAFYAENGSLSVNNGPPAVGRAAIAKEAQAFMTTFPDMMVMFDKLEPRGDTTAFHWTLTGTNTGPGGTGRRVRISGYELWKIDKDGLIRESKGHFDAAEYERQLKGR